jgi:copper chaperone
MVEHEILIEGMSCQHCVMSVQKALAGIPGVEVRSVRVGSAVVAYDESSTPLHVITAAIQDVGFVPLP